VSGTAGRSGLFFMSLRDIGLFLRSARTDAAIAAASPSVGAAAAFDAAYAGGDPWASGDPRYRYQRRKYEIIAGLLPSHRRFAKALDLGSGAGLLARHLAPLAEAVHGIDISANAVAQARSANADLPHLTFSQGDVLDLPDSLDGRFDLVVLADTLYYLPPPLTDATLKTVALRIARLLRPGGVCLLANHFFSGADADSRLSRRIHQAFAWSPAWHTYAEHRRPFYLVSVLEKA
jgi:predicted TPR repeat methyltransferase